MTADELQQLITQDTPGTPETNQFDLIQLLVGNDIIKSTFISFGLLH